MISITVYFLRRRPLRFRWTSEPFLRCFLAWSTACPLSRNSRSRFTFPSVAPQTRSPFLLP